MDITTIMMWMVLLTAIECPLLLTIYKNEKGGKIEKPI